MTDPETGKIGCICLLHAPSVPPPATQEDLLCDGCRAECSENMKRGLPLPAPFLPPRRVPEKHR